VLRTKEEIAKDDYILGVLMAAHETSHRLVLPSKSDRGWGVGSGHGYISADEDGPVCAVGAGLIYAGLGLWDLYQTSAPSVFGDTYDVPYAYADGVSDGYEGSLSIRDFGSLHHAYLRGYAVGDAFFGATHLAEAP
jgi:hypothetical protein